MASVKYRADGQYFGMVPVRVGENATSYYSAR